MFDRGSKPFYLRWRLPSSMCGCRLCGVVFLAFAFTLLAIFFGLKGTPAPTATFTVKETRPSAPYVGKLSRLPSRAPFQSSTVPSLRSDFHRTIIDNNLFRPLGWMRRVPAPAYRLTGTIIPRDSKTPPHALILATANQRTHIVIPGDKLAADTTVVEIRSKHVILEGGGQRITLKLDTSAWLSTSSRRFSRPR